MEMRLADLGPPKLPFSVCTKELRNRFSETVNHAAFGTEPVLITRNGRKIAAIISIADLAFLDRMKQRKEEIMKENVPTDPPGMGGALAQRLYWDIFFG